MLKKLTGYFAIILLVALGAVPSYGRTTTPRYPAFAWGAGLVSNIDMSQHNMSSLGINAAVGMRWRWIRFLGVGAEGNFMVSNSARTYPLYLNFKTDFSRYNQLLFLDIRGGVGLSYLNEKSTTDAYFSGGIGVTLARGKSFASHLVLAYTYLGQKECYNGDFLRKCPGISMATLRLGVVFQIEKQPSAEQLAAQAAPATAKKVDGPVFVNYAMNRIELPATADRAKWAALATELDSARSQGRHVDIMQIGDSHTQAEMGTEVTRRMLQHRYGNGGRGLLSAYVPAGSNQPLDYRMQATLPVDSQARLLKRPWDIQPGFTGVAASGNRANRITFKTLGCGHKFDKARIFTSEGEHDVNFPSLTDSAMFYLFPGERVFGVYVENTEEPGVVFSTIGNNGACYSDYLLLENFASDVAKFNPRLIILSMGTNEAYSTMTDEEITASMERLTDSLRQTNPEAVFMVVTPMESDRRIDGGFELNTRVAQVRDLIVDYARNNGLGIWDFYNIAGGEGSADKWISAGLMNRRDHVHLTGDGYRLQGRLAGEALLNLLEKLRN